jgi:DNA-binding LacI/PurR family transcriptional regulator
MTGFLVSDSSLSSRVDQVVEILRQGMLRRRWRETLPGRDRLAGQLGCSHATVELAMRRLVRDGWLVSQGAGKRRRIVLPKGETSSTTLRVRILLYDNADRALPFEAELLAQLQKAGFAAEFALKSQQDLGMRSDRVAKFVTKTPADAWVVISGSREILEWFATQPVPAISVFSHLPDLSLAAVSPRKTPAMIAAVRALTASGHKRIVMLSRRERRKPKPGLFEQNFLDELGRLGLPVSENFNLPDWGESAAGLHSMLTELFRVTPPTALIIVESELMHAIHQFMSRSGLRSPEDLSLLCCDEDLSFRWCEPGIAHIRCDYELLIKRVLKWVRKVPDGRDNKNQLMFDAELVHGGTLGPPPGHPHPIPLPGFLPPIREKADS